MDILPQKEYDGYMLNGSRSGKTLLTVDIAPDGTDKGYEDEKNRNVCGGNVCRVSVLSLIHI